MELLVVVVIVMALAMLSLAGMAGARKRVKIDRTKSTIRKIHEIVMPQYEDYVRRRVPSSNAGQRLLSIRQLICVEMPDSWNDVGTVGGPLTGPVLAYAATKQSLNEDLTKAGKPTVDNEIGDAECLYMIASRGPSDPDAMERFRTEEVGDTDKDGAPEFLDAWGRPIRFVRWAPGYSASPGTPGVRSAPLIPAANGVSVVQFADPANFHDPLDPMRQDPAGYALIPLVVSAGPDGNPGLQMSNGWSTATLFSIVGSTYGSPDASGAHTDNITNHDLSKK